MAEACAESDPRIRVFHQQNGGISAAADRLSALYACGGGPVVGVASFMARRAPRLLSRAYQLRRACLRTP
jgi:hypothetical protein